MKQTIYKLDSKSKMRFLTIENKNNQVIQVSGLVDSDNPVIHVSECIAKNTGKTNATTAEEQALSEAKAKLKKKLEEGYYSTPEEAQGGTLILPQLAKDFKKEESKVRYPCFIQPKLDGLRILKKGNDLISRKNKKIDTLEHIANQLDLYNDVIFDGEGWASGFTFQENMTFVKKYREGLTEQMKYHVYDIVDTELNFSERYEKLKNIIETEQPENIVLVPTFQINSNQELLTYHAKFVSEGYEGTMVRIDNGGYDINKRSSNLLKFKDFQDLACEIVDVKPSEKRPDQGSFICKLEDGTTFGCGMRFTHDERKNILLHPEEYIGKVAEVRFFEYSDEGVPRFPVACGIRIDL